MVNRTLSAIISGFNRLITEVDFQKISVEMIMNEAGVSRSTFYRYFKDKYEVMKEIYYLNQDTLPAMPVPHDCIINKIIPAIAPIVANIPPQRLVLITTYLPNRYPPTVNTNIKNKY